MIVILSKACILKSLTYYVLGSMQSAFHEFFHVIFIAGLGADELSTVSEGRKATCARTRSCSVEECGPNTHLLDSKKVALNPASPEVTAWSQKACAVWPNGRGSRVICSNFQWNWPQRVKEIGFFSLCLCASESWKKPTWQPNWNVLLGFKNHLSFFISTIKNVCSPPKNDHFMFESGSETNYMRNWLCRQGFKTLMILRKIKWALLCERRLPAVCNKW